MVSVPIMTPPKERAHSQRETIHKTVFTNFNKTLTGKIYDKELSDIFSIMLICLKLKGETSNSKLKFLLKECPYLFQLQDALHTMVNLNVEIEFSTTTTTSISYSIKPDLGLALVRRFFKACFLHCPIDRTRAEPKHGVLLQPTAKGVAIVYKFCKSIGMSASRYPDIVKSAYNSMELFKFDRDSVSDKILYSDYSLLIFFKKLMGPAPNVWSPTNKPDAIKVVHLEEHGVSFCGDTKDFAAKNATFAAKQNYKSPYHHRYFTNPESAAHSQYYMSEHGVRVFQNKVFHSSHRETVVKFCMSGKAICQWLCECTDVTSVSQAIEVALLLIKAKLLSPILNLPSVATTDTFIALKDAFYTLSSLGKKTCDWDTNKLAKTTNKLLDLYGVDSIIDKLGLSGVSVTSEELELEKQRFSLKDVIKDPGMRYLFQRHLEKEYCSENLNAYLQLQQFGLNLKLLGKLLQHEKAADDSVIHGKIFKLVNTNYSLAYNIYFTYLSWEAPYVLNINYSLRDKITKIMERGTSSEDMLQTPISSFKLTVQLDSKEKNQFIQFPLSLTRTDFEITTEIKHKRTSSTSSNITADQNVESQQVNVVKDSCLDTIKTLSEIMAVFAQISDHIYRLMELDSLPKFLDSCDTSFSITAIQSDISYYT